MKKLLKHADQITSKNAVFVTTALFFTLVIGIFFTQRIYYTIREKTLIFLQEKSLKKIQRENSAKYNALLNKPANPSGTRDKSKENINTARGTLPIRFVFVKPNSISNTSINPLYKKLVSPEVAEKYALSHIPTYIREQSKNYNISDINIIPSYSEVYTLSALEKVGNFADIWDKNPFGLSILQDQFEDLLKIHHEDRDQYIVFLYFDNSYESSADKTNGTSIYDYKKFRSFTSPETKRAYINVYNFNTSMVPTVTLIAIHEILHLYGATDKYIENPEENGPICTQEGRGNPTQAPIWPQKTGDIMCLFVEKGIDNFIRGSLPNNNLVINKFTAEEIGW